MSSKIVSAFAVAALTVAGVTTAGHVQAGDLAKGAHHTITMADTTCAVGKECVITISLNALAGYHINKDYPAKLKADEVAGVEFMGTDAGGKNVFSKAVGDYKVDSERLGTLKIKVKVAKAGAVSITGNFKFCVCSDKECVPDSAQLKIPVTAK